MTNGILTVKWKEFDHLDPAMHFVAEETGVSDPEVLGAALSAALVKTPVMMSFTRIISSTYPRSHIVTVFGIQLPPASMDDTAHPRLLLVNSAVKYGGNVKNICAVEDLSDNDRYRAIAAFTDSYDLNLFAPKPYLITYIEAK